MKKLFLVLFCAISGILFSQNNNMLHTGEGIFTLVNYGSSWDVTFVMTSVSERWGEPGCPQRQYNPTNNYETSSFVLQGHQVVPPYVPTAYFDLSIDNLAGINPIFAVGKYRISAIEGGVERSFFYMDWRTSGYYVSPDVYFKYDMANHVFLDESGTQNINGTVQTIWDLVPGITHETSGLGLYTNQTYQNSHPVLSWNAYIGTCTGYYVHKILTCESGTITEQYFTTSTSWTDDNFTITNPRFADADAEYWVTAKLSDTEQSAGANHTFATGHSWIAWKVNNKNDDPVLSYKLNQNYPNPFNPTTAISYELKNSGFVSLKVYNVLGKVINDLVNEIQEVGQHEISFDATNLPSGTYIYKIQSGNFVQVRKMLLLK